jgi:uncharacterized protein DUF3631
MTPQETLSKHGIRLESYKPGRHYTICPKCSHTRSTANQKKEVLGITIGDDGSVCWGCNHCDWTGPEKGNGEWQQRDRSELTTHMYRDADGVVRFRKMRNLPGRKPKCWFEHPDGRGGWSKGLTKDINSKILYRADELAKAIAAGRVIACVEGEKDADNLWSLGIAATCNAHGAHDPTKKQKPKWQKAHSEQLAGADIVVFNDNDAAGYEHAEATCRLSLGVAKRVRRLDLKPHWPDIPKGGDISDWLALKHTREELDALIAGAPDCAPANAQQPKPDQAQGSATIDDDAEIEKLARMGPLEYERSRKAAAEQLGIKRLSLLDSLVKAKRAELGLDGEEKQGQAIDFPAVEPWPQPVDGVQLLNDLAKTIRSYVVMSDAERDICALWTVHTYVIKRFMISPKLSIRSTVRNCGKTTLLDVLSHLVFRAWVTGSITKAALFRVISKWHPTLLIDEVDSFVGDDEELRGILNNSHRYDGTVTRTVGDDHEPRKFSVYAAVALSGIGGLAATLADRSVTAALKRRRPNEPITQLRIGRMGHLHELRRRITRWVFDHEERISECDPQMPERIINRAADNWTVLLAIAEAAGGEWPERARKAAVANHNAAADDAAILEILLADIRDSFAVVAVQKTLDGLEYVTSADLVAALLDIEGHPWAEWGKNRKPITQHQLARLLKPLSIITQKVGSGKTGRVGGYVLAQFEEAFERYLGPKGDSDSDSRTECDEIRTSDDSDSDGTDPGSPSRKCKKPNNDGLPSDRPSRKAENGKANTSADSEPCAPRNSEPAPDPAELCAYCNHPGGNAVAFGDGQSIRLHRECEQPWIECRMAEEGIWRA